jgi:pseudouridine 5'-phosphatase
MIVSSNHKPHVNTFYIHSLKLFFILQVATSSHRDSFEIKTKFNQELFKLFDGVICGDDPEVKHGKPATDLFLAAREKLGNPPLEQCLVFEDALNGIQAARNAGMPVIWVPDPGLAALYPGVNGATEMLLSMELFDPAKYGLPSYIDDDKGR